MNYLLARWIVTSPAGSAAFNEQLGLMTLLSYPMIAIPSMVMMLAIFYNLWRTIHDMTRLPLEEIAHQEAQQEKVWKQSASAVCLTGSNRINGYHLP